MLLTLLGLAVVAYGLASRSFLTRWLVLRELSKALGGEARASAVSYDSSGTLVIENGELRAPGVEGEGGVIFRAKRLEADLSLWSLVKGQPEVHRVLLDEPLARLSQSVDDDSVNVGRLKPAGGGGAKLSVIPRVLVRSGTIELGEHISDPGRTARFGPVYTPLRSIPVGGEVERSTGGGSMHVSFRELGPDGQALAGPGGLQVEGDITPDQVSLYLGVVSLANWPPESVPAPIRGAYRQLALDGHVYGAELTYYFTGGVTASARLAGVAMTLPVEARPGEDAEGNPIPLAPEDRGKRLRMQKVHGDVTLTSTGLRASLNGVLEDLPYHVDLDYQGSTGDAPFRCAFECRNFQLRQKPELLKFAPGVVRRRLEQFSDPTGTLDAEVVVTRGLPTPQGLPATPVVTGTLRFRNTTAAFERFPYRFYNMRGEVEFSADQVRLVRIEGDAPGGAKLLATGLIAPPTDDAGVLVDVTVSGLPIDRTLAAAMGERGKLLEALFSTTRYDELVAAGLIVTPERAGEATPQRPAFRLGGIADVHTTVRRDPGAAGEWHDRVEIRLGEAGVLTERVPYPMIARGVTILKEDAIATVKGGTYTGLLGGSASIEGEANIDALVDPGRSFAPTIRATLRGAPLDARLVSALPRTEALERSGVRARLLALRPEGTVDLEARVGMKDDAVDFAAHADLRGVTLRPEGEEGVRFRGVTGTIDANPSGVTASLGGTLAPAAEGPGCEATLALLVDAGAPGGWEVSARAPALDVSLPVETFVGVFAPEASAKVADLRRTRRPQGVVDARASASRRGEQEPSGVLDLLGVPGVSFEAPAGRVTARVTEGSVGVEFGGGLPARVRFREARGVLTRDGRDEADVLVDGVAGADGAPAGGPLRVEAVGARFESALLREGLASSKLAGAVAALDPRGAFDLSLRLAPEELRPDSWDIRGTVMPRSLTLRLGGRDVAFTTIAGTIDLHRGEGRLKQIALAGEGWGASVDGAWMRATTGELTGHALVRLDAQSLTPELRAILPEPLRTAASELKVEVAGPFTVEGLDLSLTFDAEGTLRSYGVRGSAAVRDASLDAGVVLENVAGRLDFDARRSPGASGGDWELAASLDRVTAAGVEVRQARARLLGEVDGEVTLQHFSGVAHGGRVTGQAQMGPSRPGGREYQVDLQATGVRFASLLADLTPGGTPEGELDESRGRLDANLSMSGVSGDVASRRGRGGGVVSGGRVMSLPLVVPLVRVSNLELPLDERLDYGSAECYIEGPYLNFEELSLFSRSVQIVGFGVVEWPRLELDMRFRPRARHRIPVLTGVLEGIRNELITAEVQGTLKKPEVKMTSMSGTTRLLGRVLGSGPREQRRRLDLLEQRAQPPGEPRPLDRAPVGGEPK